MPEILLVFGDDGVVRWKPAGAARGGGKYNWVDGPRCPDHGAWKVVPGGYSEKTGRDYGPFYSCSDRDCLNRPGKAWVEQNPPQEDESPPWPDEAGF